MTGLDANVLVRYLTEDDLVQSKRAADLITTATARGERCFISAIVLCELAWVLRGAYRISQVDLIVTLDRILATTQFVVGDKDAVRQALDVPLGPCGLRRLPHRRAAPRRGLPEDGDLRSAAEGPCGVPGDLGIGRRCLPRPGRRLDPPTALREPWRAWCTPRRRRSRYRFSASRSCFTIGA